MKTSFILIWLILSSYRGFALSPAIHSNDTLTSRKAIFWQGESMTKDSIMIEVEVSAFPQLELVHWDKEFTDDKVNHYSHISLTIKNESKESKLLYLGHWSLYVVDSMGDIAAHTEDLYPDGKSFFNSLVLKSKPELKTSTQDFPRQGFIKRTMSTRIPQHSFKNLAPQDHITITILIKNKAFYQKLQQFASSSPSLKYSFLVLPTQESTLITQGNCGDDHTNFMYPSKQLMLPIEQFTIGRNSFYAGMNPFPFEQQIRYCNETLLFRYLLHNGTTNTAVIPLNLVK